MNGRTSNITIEWAPFEIAVNVTDEQFLDAAANLETNFLSGRVDTKFSIIFNQSQLLI